ncbi:uncharacterized protein KZ484_008088 [Pholidichthys leucotaenia]
MMPTNDSEDLLEDSGVVHIGKQSVDSDDDFASSLPWTENQLEENGADVIQAPKINIQVVSVPAAAGILSLPPSSLEGPQNSKETRYAYICRVMIVDALLEVFSDKDVINMELKMEFRNEMAVDDFGVSRDVYTAFWERFLENCKGEEERVPRLRPDFSEAQ